MICIIATGNNLREDDGAGLVLAAHLEQLWQGCGLTVERITSQQLLPELAEDISKPEVSAVVFVDARVMLPGEAAVVVVDRVAPLGSRSPCLGHHFDPATLLAYVELLAHPSAGGSRTVNGPEMPPAWLVTVPGVRFGYGEGLSPQAVAAIEAAIDDPTSSLQGLVGSLATRAPCRIHDNG